MIDNDDISATRLSAFDQQSMRCDDNVLNRIDTMHEKTGGRDGQLGIAGDNIALSRARTFLPGS
jgi:hypothetical protein